jgi:Icc-related predicted phosphoesterase
LEVGVPIFGGKKKTKVFYTTDVHGSTVVFKKFINAAKFYEVEVLILGGDMVGKMIIPIVEQATRFALTTQTRLRYQPHDGKSRAELKTAGSSIVTRKLKNIKG